MGDTNSLENFERALGHIRKSVQPLTHMSRDETRSLMGRKDSAKLSLVLAYGVSSLFYMFLKTQGVSPSSHPVKAELDRIRAYIGRLKKAGDPPEERKLKVDQAASRRFIDSALNRDEVWRKVTKKGPKASPPPRGQEEGQMSSGDIGRGAGAGAGAGAGSKGGGGARGVTSCSKVGKRKREKGEAIGLHSTEHQGDRGTGDTNAWTRGGAEEMPGETDTPLPIPPSQQRKAGVEGNTGKGRRKQKGEGSEKARRLSVPQK